MTETVNIVGGLVSEGVTPVPTGALRVTYEYGDRVESFTIPDAADLKPETLFSLVDPEPTLSFLLMTGVE